MIMNRCFSLAVRRATRMPLWLGLLFGVALGPVGARAADDFYINYSTVTTAPMIDAYNFVNYGTFESISTTYPFETSDTLNFTNYGTLSSARGSAGWWFSYSPASTGQRELADNFVNEDSGIVESSGSSTFNRTAMFFPEANYVWVYATNIINSGYMSIGGAGWLKLVGTNIDLTRSGLDALPLQGAGSGNIGTNFVPEAGISDVYWGQTNLNFATPNIWGGSIAVSPPHPVQPAGMATVTVSPPLVADTFGVTNATALLNVTNYVGTNPPGMTITNVSPGSLQTGFANVPTSIFRQAAFVGLSDPNRETAAIHFYQANPASVFRTVAVQIVVPSQDPVTQNPENTTLYLYDTLASETTRGLSFNFNAGTARPANYTLTRVDTGPFARGQAGQGPPAPNYLYDANTFSNAVVSGEFAGYGALVDYLPERPPSVPFATITNLPGRVQIYGDTVNLDGARMRGQGELRIVATNLVGTLAGTVVDCQNLSYLLGADDGNLSVTNLAKLTVDRVRGDVYAWSGLWTNTITILYTNNYVIASTNFDKTGTNVASVNLAQSPLTNYATITLHALLFDTSGLLTQLPVHVWDMVTQPNATNAVIDDNMAVVEKFLVLGQSFTLNGSLAFSSDFTTGQGTRLTDWDYTNAPNLLYFTNNGTLSIPDSATFGIWPGEPSRSYRAFVNKGTINANPIKIKADYLEDEGGLVSGGPVTIQCDQANLENGQITAGGNLQMQSGDVKLYHASLTSANGSLTLFATNSLLDAGGGSANQIIAMDGVSVLPGVPGTAPTADLLGTTIQSKAPDFVRITDTWPARDLGDSAAGYSNNLAVGILTLGPVGKGTSSLELGGTGPGANGLYADLLDLSNLGTNLQEVLFIDPNLTLYYAAAKLSFTPPPNSEGIPQEPEEYLDGLSNGHLRWVKDFAGPNSGVDLLVNGVTVRVNAALRFSKIIDSNGNGIPNFYDSNPFGLGLAGSLVNGQATTPGFAISWNAAPNAAYVVEYATDLGLQNWKPLTTYTNTASVTRRVTVTDANAPVSGVQRYYRIQYRQ